MPQAESKHQQLVFLVGVPGAAGVAHLVARAARDPNDRDRRQKLHRLHGRTAARAVALLLNGDRLPRGAAQLQAPVVADAIALLVQQSAVGSPIGADRRT